MTAPTGKALAMKLHLQEYGHAPPLIAPTEATLIVSGIAAATTLDLQHTKFKSFAFGMLTATPDCKPKLDLNYGHVEQHDLLDAQLLQAGGISEIGKLVAVIIDVLADVAVAVQLAADADPALDDAVIIVWLGPRPGRPVWPG